MFQISNLFSPHNKYSLIEITISIPMIYQQSGYFLV